MSVTAKMLIAGRQATIFVSRDHTVQQAFELMVKNDFSQLPVVDGNNRPIGLITSDSILRGLVNFESTVDKLLVKDVLRKHQAYTEEDEIFDILDGLKTNPVVLITNVQGILEGIIADWDTAEYFRLRAQDMMFIEDIEQNLKDHIRAAHTNTQTGILDEQTLQNVIDVVPNSPMISSTREAIKRYFTILNDSSNEDESHTKSKSNERIVDKVCKALTKGGKNLEDLTLNQFIEILTKQWETYGQIFNIKSDDFKKMLNKVRDIRNTLAHFRDAITQVQRDSLIFCLDWFENNRPPDFSLLSQDSEVSTIISENSEINPTQEELAENDSRYAKLALHLQNQPLSSTELTLTFDGIEKIIEGQLPPSAREHRYWWANNNISNAQSRQWLGANWKVAPVNMVAERVTFVRMTERAQLYISFFAQLLQKLSDKVDFPTRDAEPRGTSWHIIGAFRKDNRQKAVLSFSFTRNNQFRVELYIDGGENTEKNKEVYESLYKQREIIDSNTGYEKSQKDLDDLSNKIHWERLDSRRASRVAIYHSGSIEADTNELERLQTWAVNTMIGFQHMINKLMVADGFEYSG